MSTFHADFYNLYRPLYPAATYAGLGAPGVVLDLGAGTGQSAESLLRVLAPRELHVLDPDPRMLERAQTRLKPGAHEPQEIGYLADRVEHGESHHLRGRPASIYFHLAAAEAVPLPDASVDLVTIASAFHWMDRARVRDECKRLLRPGGHLLVYEYQFPKCAALPELNEWIRRQFNQLWKAPGQVPRGNFRDAVLAPLRGDLALKGVSEGPVSMRISLTPEELHGLILSQSRYLHYERTLGGADQVVPEITCVPEITGGVETFQPRDAVAQERARILAEISKRMSGNVPSASGVGSVGPEFDFALARALFVRA